MRVREWKQNIVDGKVLTKISMARTNRDRLSNLKMQYYLNIRMK